MTAMPGRWIALLLALCGAGPVSAQMYRCIDAAGRTTYTDQKCPEAQSQKELSVTDNALDASDLRRQAEANRSERELADLQRQGGVQGATDLGAGQRCQTARRNLAIARNNSRPSRDAIADAQAAVDQQCATQPALARAEPACRETRLLQPSPFHGIPDERLTLADGTAWQVVARRGTQLPAAEHQPNVTLCAAQGHLYLKGRRYTVIPQ